MPAGAACARSRARRRSPGNNLVLTLDVQLQEIAERAFGERRGALVAIEPGDRRRARLRDQAGLRPQPVRRRHRPAELDRAQQLARPADEQPRASPAPIRRARPSSRSWRSPRSTSASARRSSTISDPGYFNFGGRALPRRQGRRPRRGRPVQVDRRLVRHLLLPLANDLGIDAHLALHEPVRLRQPHRHRHRGRGDRRAAVAGVEAAALPAARAAEVVRRARPSRSASARATTPTRRCSSRRRWRRSPTTA